MLISASFNLDNETHLELKFGPPELVRNFGPYWVLNITDNRGRVTLLLNGNSAERLQALINETFKEH